MKRNVRLRVGILTLALATSGMVITPIVGYAQTQSKERRDERQDDRQGSRDTKTDGAPGRPDQEGRMQEGG